MTSKSVVLVDSWHSHVPFARGKLDERDTTEAFAACRLHHVPLVRTPALLAECCTSAGLLLLCW